MTTYFRYTDYGGSPAPHPSSPHHHPGCGGALRHRGVPGADPLLPRLLRLPRPTSRLGSSFSFHSSSSTSSCTKPSGSERSEEVLATTTTSLAPTSSSPSLAATSHLVAAVGGGGWWPPASPPQPSCAPRRSLSPARPPVPSSVAPGAVQLAFQVLSKHKTSMHCPDNMSNVSLSFFPQSEHPGTACGLGPPSRPSPSRSGWRRR